MQASEINEEISLNYDIFERGDKKPKARNSIQTYFV